MNDRDPQLPPMAPPLHVASLPRWLDRSRAWHIEYGGFLSNHLAHNLVVLSAAGADEARLQWWEDLYTGRLEDDPGRVEGALEPARQDRDPVPVTGHDWRARLERDREHFPAFRSYFEVELRSRGRAAVLREHLPELLPGLAGAALHPLIHTGWSLDADHDGMLADGLAYLATAHQPIATGAGHAPPASLWSSEAPGILASTAEFLAMAERQGFTAIAQQASETPTYRALGRGFFQPRVIAFDDPDLPFGSALNDTGPLGLPKSAESLRPAVEEAVALLAAALRASANEFFVLHGLTSLYALVRLLPFLDADNRRIALAHWWRALMAVMVAQGAPGLAGTLEAIAAWHAAAEDDSRSASPKASSGHGVWTSLLAATLDSRDEHVPKAVYVLGRFAAWGVFGARTIGLLEAAARDIARSHPSGDVSRNLWTASPAGAVHEC